MAENEPMDLEKQTDATNSAPALEPVTGTDAAKKPATWQYGAVLAGVTVLMGGLVAGTWIWLNPTSGQAEMTAGQGVEQAQPVKLNRRDELAAMNPFKQPEQQTQQEQVAEQSRTAVTNAIQHVPEAAQMPSAAQPSEQPAQQEIQPVPEQQHQTVSQEASAPPAQPVEAPMARELQEMQDRAANGRYSNIDIGIGSSREQVIAKFGAPESGNDNSIRYNGMMFSFAEPEHQIVNGVIFYPQNVVGKLTFAQVQKVLGKGKVESAEDGLYLTYRAGKYNLYFNAADLGRAIETVGVTALN